MGHKMRMDHMDHEYTHHETLIVNKALVKPSFRSK